MRKSPAPLSTIRKPVSSARAAIRICHGHRLDLRAAEGSAAATGRRSGETLSSSPCTSATTSERLFCTKPASRSDTAQTVDGGAEADALDGSAEGEALSAPPRARYTRQAFD